GSDTFTINVTGPTSATGPLALNGLDGSDVYTINLASPIGSVVSPVNLNDTGTTGSDGATINAGDTNNRLLVTATAVTSTAANIVQMVTYAGLDSLTINIGNGNDGIIVQSTSGPTAGVGVNGTPVTINGGNGNDTYSVAAADLSGQHSLLAPQLF